MVATERFFMVVLWVGFGVFFGWLAYIVSGKAIDGFYIGFISFIALNVMSIYFRMP